MPNGPSARAAAVTLTTTTLTSVLTVLNAQGASNNTTAQFVSDVSPTVVVTGSLNVTAGTGTTAVAISCVDSAGVQIGTTQTDTLAAGNSESISFAFQDARGLSTPPNSYVIRVQQTGATGNGTVNEVVGYIAFPG